MMRWAMCGVVGICLLASLVLARPGVVKTKDGGTIEGDVTEKDETVVVAIHGVQTVINRDDVVSIDYPPPFEEQFQTQRAKLDAKDVAGRIELGRLAFQNRRYDLAQQVLDEALAINPDSREANDLSETVRAHMKLEAAPKPGAASPRDAASLPASPTEGRGLAQTPLLTPDDINTIRQAELKETDTRVHFRFDNDVRQQYVTAKALSVSAFMAGRPFQQAWKILGDGDAKLRKDVRVQDDPGSLREFHLNIQNMILAGCAAANCHGSSAGGPLVLNTKVDSDAATYTNFYILQKYVKAPPGAASSVLGNGSDTLINRDHPEQSLLAQYGLPASSAEQHHPDVQGFKPIFTGKNDAHYRRLINWMGSGLKPVTQDYGIDFQPGTGATNSRPTTQQAQTP